MKNPIFIFLFLLFSNLSAQTVVESFSVTQVDSTAHVDWTIGPGNTCSDLMIQYSTDSITFNTIYEYPGICGNTNSSQSYSWVHLAPKCGTRSFYRVASLTEGTLGLTTADFVCFGETGVVATYNQLTGNIVIGANIPSGEVWNFTLYDLNGHRILETELSEYSTAVLWNPQHSGIYIYEVMDAQGESRNGHLLIRKQ